MSRPKRSDNWIDGLRGIAALVVVTYHLCSSFADWLNSPALEENGAVSIFQYPFLRLITGGRSAIALFFIITGYVNSFNARKQSNNGDGMLVLSKLSRNTIVRVARLVVPTNTAIVMTWVICQLRGYRVASEVDSPWIRNVAVPAGPTLNSAISRLFWNLTLYWHAGATEYDKTYWTIPFFLHGSMIVYLTLMATVFTRPRGTKMVLLFLYSFAWSGGSALMEMNIYAGMFLAELNADYGAKATSALPWPVPALMMTSGLFLASFPDDNPGWMPWSRTIDSWTLCVIPAGAEVNRFVVTIGTTIFVFGVFFSADARRILSHPVMNFLGRISFPIYLIHNTLIRTVLTWALYRHSAFAKGLHNFDKEGNPVFLDRSGYLAFMVSIPLFYAILIYLAHMWTVYVDPRCEKVISWGERQIFGDENENGATKEGTLEGLLKL